jgi:hypothetical protein
MYPAGNRTPAPEPQLPELLPTSAVWSIVRESLRLSERELKIAQGVFAKQEQDIIAASNGFTPEFVYRSLQRIYIKLRIGSRRELNSRITEILAAHLKYPQD